MRIRYFEDTDTLLIEFREVPVAETRDLDVNTVADVGNDYNKNTPIRMQNGNSLLKSNT